MPEHDSHDESYASAQAMRPLAVAPEPASRATRQPVAAACGACRKHKAKCSGERPTCQRCYQRNIECSYTERPGERASTAAIRRHRRLEVRIKDIQALFELLKTLPEQKAQEILARIRSHDDVGTILKHVETGDMLLQIAVVPETRFRYELPYKAEIPEEFISDNPYIGSLIYEGALLYPSGGCAEEPGSLSTSKYAGLHPDEYQSLYLRPFHAARVIETQLLDVKVSTWTDVCDDDVLMRDLLNCFLQCEYQFTAAFQKDLFLQDMLAHRDDFCSSLLVHVVLGCACVCDTRFSNRAQYWNPRTLLYRFIAEAKRLWELEVSRPRITTIQAGILLHVFHNLCGLDEIGRVYGVQAVTLARKMRLFDSPGSSNDARIRRGRAYCAWALFNWETLVAFSFITVPLITEVPKWRLPDPSEDPTWYGEIWLKYPSSHRLLSSSFGILFKATSEFRVIMNDYCQAAYSKGSKIDLLTAHTLRVRLGTWFDGLPEPMLPKKAVLPKHLQLHMYYNHLLLTLYEPLLYSSTLTPSRTSFSSPPGPPSTLSPSDESTPTPAQIVTSARRHLQTLIRLYYLRHGYDSMDLFIVIPLMLTASDSVDLINDSTPVHTLETLRSTLILATHGLYKQRRNHYLAEALFRVIRGRMRPQEVNLFRGTMNLAEGREEAEDVKTMRQAVRSQWPVSVVKNTEDLNSNILTNLVESYAHVNIED